MKRGLIILLTCLAFVTSIHAQGEAAGYLRFNTEPADDVIAWEDPARFLDVPFAPEISFRGNVGSASGSEITAAGSPLWTVNEFATTHFLEIVSGTAAGTRFTIASNTAVGATLDLNGGTLSGVAANDEFIVAPLWTLNRLFPEGLNLTASTEILFAPNFSTTFIYRADLGRWVDSAGTATDVGEDIIPLNTNLVIRQHASEPIKPFIWGFHAPTPVMKATINYLQIGNNNFADAISLSAESGSISVDSTGANGESGEPQHEGNTTTASVWFRYTATQDGTVTISTENSGFDTIVAAYSGSTVGGLTLVGANDDLGAGTTSELTFSVSTGETYQIALDGKAGAIGTAYLAWAFSEDANESTMENWATTDFGLSGNGLLFSADDDGDQLSLLEEYAFNLDPTVASIALLVPGSGTSGLPFVDLDTDHLTVEYIRRRNDTSLTYIAEFSDDLLTGYAAGTGGEMITIIDAEFERVVVSDGETTSSSTRRFGRVKIQLSSP